MLDGVVSLVRAKTDMFDASEYSAGEVQKLKVQSEYKTFIPFTIGLCSLCLRLPTGPLESGLHHSTGDLGSKPPTCVLPTGWRGN